MKSKTTFSISRGSMAFFFGMLRFTYYGEVRKNVFRLVHINGKCVTFFASALLQERFRMV